MKKKTIRILLIEDVPADAVMVNHALKRAGLKFSLDRVETPEAFEKELEERPPDIILSDHGLPRFDAFAALERARERCPEAPFIFVTSARGEQAAIETFESGATDYVLKEQLNKLAPAVRRALRKAGERRRARRRAQALEQRVRERTAQLETLNQELEAFNYSVSHDLRTPLRHIQGYVEILLSESASLDENTRDHLLTISRAAENMGKLIDALLEFSRMGRAAMRNDPVQMGEVVESARSELSHEIKNRQIDWRIAELPKVRGDSLMLLQVMINLLSNALKYTRTRESPRIEIGTVDTGRDNVFFVRDNGVGFENRFAERIFDVFYRLPSGIEIEGAGIGLAVVRRIVHRHGGRVWAEGVPDTGATIFFSLPESRDSQP